MRLVLGICTICAAMLLSGGTSSEEMSVPLEPDSPSAQRYIAPAEVSRIKDPAIDESSGLAASARYPDAFWTHNDSGDSARIFLIHKDGRTLAEIAIRGTSAVDWEDIASFTLRGEGHILIADVGDNAKRREKVTLYFLREPELDLPSAKDPALKLEIDYEKRIDFTYPNGPLDCEAVAVDAAESTIYLISKALTQCEVYSLPLLCQGSESPGIATFVTAIQQRFPTAMDISPDGKRAVLLTYGDAFEFVRAPEESWAQAFSRTPDRIKTPARPQGEAICYGSDGRTLYLTSEGAHQPLWKIPAADNP